MNGLIKLGVEAARLKAVGYGDTQPIANNLTVKGKEANRRVEFTIVNE
jgi:outer membrane protein OmpA-like peptidoglycan-associated protein